MVHKNIYPHFNPFLLNAWNSISIMGFHLRVPFFFLLQTCSFYISILISIVAKLRRMHIQISNIINRRNKHKSSFKVSHLEYVNNYSILRILRSLRNLMENLWLRVTLQPWSHVSVKLGRHKCTFVSFTFVLWRACASHGLLCLGTLTTSWLLSCYKPRMSALRGEGDWLVLLGVNPWKEPGKSNL